MVRDHMPVWSAQRRGGETEVHDACFAALCEFYTLVGFSFSESEEGEATQVMRESLIFLKDALEDFSGSERDKLYHAVSAQLHKAAESSALVQLSSQVQSVVDDDAQVRSFFQSWKDTKNIPKSHELGQALLLQRSSIWTFMSIRCFQLDASSVVLEDAVQFNTELGHDPTLGLLTGTPEHDKGGCKAYNGACTSIADVKCKQSQFGVAQELSDEVALQTALLELRDMTIRAKTNLGATIHNEDLAAMFVSMNVEFAELLDAKIAGSVGNILNTFGIKYLMAARKRLRDNVEVLNNEAGGMKNGTIWWTGLDWANVQQSLAHYQRTIGSMRGPEVEQLMLQCLKDCLVSSGPMQ